jgi:hypothetical protein
MARPLHMCVNQSLDMSQLQKGVTLDKEALLAEAIPGLMAKSCLPKVLLATGASPSLKGDLDHVTSVSHNGRSDCQPF